MFSKKDRSGDGAGQGSNRISCVSMNVGTWRTTCGLTLSCWKMAFDRPRRHTTTERKLLEIYRSAFKLTLIWTSDVSVVHKWKSNPLHQVQGFYADIECKQEKSFPLGPFRLQHAEPELILRDDVVPLLYPAYCSVHVSYYAALSRKAAVIAAVQTLSHRTSG